MTDKNKAEQEYMCEKMEGYGDNIMRTITAEELKEILERHKAWLTNTPGGEQADLKYADLRKADLKYADLRYADLRGAHLKQADLRYADLQGAHLEQADLRYADLQGADLQGAHLKYANLKYANLRGAHLQLTDLKYANLQKSNLRKADLRYADLRGADLRKADLSTANFRTANLQNSFLQEAILRNVVLYGTKLQKVKRPWLIHIGAIGSRQSETMYFADYDNVQCGCWNNYKGGTLSEFEKRVNEVYPAESKIKEYQRYRIEYLSAIKMFKSMREAYIESIANGKNE